MHRMNGEDRHAARSTGSLASQALNALSNSIVTKRFLRALAASGVTLASATLFAGTAVLGSAAALAAASSAEPGHSVILFVPDGLRAGIVDAETAPTFNRIREHGVNFANTHALFPTFTTANASAFATGHYLGDTGDFANTIASGYPVPSAGGSITPFLENDTVLGDMDAHFAGNYLNEESLLAAARARGFATAAIGKLGPVSIQDVSERGGANTIVIDDWTGQDRGLPLGTE